MKIKSVATQKGYLSDIQDWRAYARKNNLPEFPIDEARLAAYLGHLSKRKLKLSTMHRRCAAISQWHQERGETSPTTFPKIRELFRGLARKHGSAPTKKRALTTDMIQEILAKMGSTPEEVRDRALFLVGICTGKRRAELAAMQWEHVDEEPDGSLTILIPFSKTDQVGMGTFVGIPLVKGIKHCPIKALKAWKKTQGTFSGPIFNISGKTVARRIKHYVQLIGLDPEEFSGHSFRSGFVSEAYRSGVSMDDIQEQTGHKSEKVARGYVQRIEKSKNLGARGVIERFKK